MVREMMMMMMKVCVWMMMMMVACTNIIHVADAETYGSETRVIYVGGKVKCQDCSKDWNEWVQGSSPIKGSRVSITCLDERRKMIYYGSDSTDDDGVFEITVEKTVHGKKLNPKNCIVRLVSSPDKSCNVATNFAHGKTGVKLRQPSIVYREVTKYMLGTFYYTSPACEEPDTSHQGSY